MQEFFSRSLSLFDCFLFFPPNHSLPPPPPTFFVLLRTHNVAGNWPHARVVTWGRPDLEVNRGDSKWRPPGGEHGTRTILSM